MFTFNTRRIVIFCATTVILAISIFSWDRVFVALFGDTSSFRYRRGDFAIHFVSVGNGDAIVIQLPSGRVGVIDGGNYSRGPDVVDYIRRRVVRTGGNIDFVINTHPHQDNVGGLLHVLNYFNVDTVYRPIIRSTASIDADNESLITPHNRLQDVFCEFIAISYQNANQVKLIESGYSITNKEHGYRLFFHTPHPDIFLVAAGVTNEISPIITLEYQGHIFVLTGNAGVFGEGLFMQTDSAQILFNHAQENQLKVHLRAANRVDSNSHEFLSFINPTSIIISTARTQIDERLEHRLDVADKIMTTQEYGHIVYRIRDTKMVQFTGFYNPPRLAWLFITLTFASFVIVFIPKIKSK